MNYFPVDLDCIVVHFRMHINSSGFYFVGLTLVIILVLTHTSNHFLVEPFFTFMRSHCFFFCIVYHLLLNQYNIDPNGEHYHFSIGKTTKSIKQVLICMWISLVRWTKWLVKWIAINWHNHWYVGNGAREKSIEFIGRLGLHRTWYQSIAFARRNRWRATKCPQWPRVHAAVEGKWNAYVHQCRNIPSLTHIKCTCCLHKKNRHR